MTTPYDRDAELLALIDELATLLRSRLVGVTWEVFLGDRDLIDLTAYRLLHIGEAAHKLSQAIKDRHPLLPWGPIYRMRNVLSHDYGGVDSLLLWETVQLRLEAVEAMARTELDHLAP